MVVGVVHRKGLLVIHGVQDAKGVGLSRAHNAIDEARLHVRERVGAEARREVEVKALVVKVIRGKCL